MTIRQNTVESSIPLDLTCLRRLKHLDIYPSTLLGERFKDGLGGGEALSKLLPSSLESITLSDVVLKDRELMAELLCAFVKRKQGLASALKTVKIAFRKEKRHNLERNPILVTPEVSKLMQEAGVQIVYEVLDDAANARDERR